jgi:hypothetical protein
VALHANKKWRGAFKKDLGYILVTVAKNITTARLRISNYEQNYTYKPFFLEIFSNGTPSCDF